MSEEDIRSKFLFRQVSQAFRSIPADKLQEIWNSEEIYRNINEFFDNPELGGIFFREARGGLELIFNPNPPNKGRVFFIIKIHKVEITERNFMQELIYGDMGIGPLDHMGSVTERVYNPFLGHKSNEMNWSDAVMKEVRDHFDNFVSNLQITQGHVDGYTCLPLPHAATAKRQKEEKTNINKLKALEQEIEPEHQFRSIHVLEGALITWTKQIKNVLKLDPEHLFLNNAHPNPLNEIDFWRSKAVHLNSIFNQLQSVKIRRILKVLDQFKSTYNAPFAKLCKEVFYARSEAYNILKYLNPLVPWFETLENEVDFENLVNHFPPIIHLILLVWKSSSYYNTPARLVILMREICNTLIRKAVNYLDGDTIFDLVEAGETATAVKMLKTVLRVFGRFKTVYFEYKAKAAIECIDNPWSVQNNAVFVRLDTFLERCHDILDFGQTIVMFSKLAKIEVGGTKGKTLTTSVAQIYADFNQAIESIRAVGKGILDLENKQFEEAFYEFRNKIKELDRRLGSIIVQGFEDASTINSKFRLLDSFDTLITRTIVNDALEKKHAALIECIRLELVEVQRIFDEQHAAPVIAHNLPPISGALTWSKSLRDRIDLPISKLKTLDKKILEREDTRDVIKLYTALIGQLSDMDNANIESWGAGIEASSQAKLKNPLLARESVTITTTITTGAGGVPSNNNNTTAATISTSNNTITTTHSLLRVNFDPLLVKLLREVKYFLLLGLEVPATAMDIYQKVEIFRRQTGNLDLIVNMYNDIQTTLLPVERPLVKSQLDRVDKTLAQGVGEGKNKTKALNWKSNGIDLFIGEAMSEVKEVNEMLQMLKGNLRNVEQTVAIWQSQTVFERGYKTVSTQDFINLQKKTRQTKLQAVKEAGQEIHRLLKDTNKKLKVSQGLPDWKAYVDFINNVVVFGLADAMTACLKTMAQQFNPQYLEANSLPALLEIQIDLLDKKVTFIPEVGYVEGNIERGAGPPNINSMGIKNIVIGWINGMLGLANAFKRLDSNEGTYLRELMDAPQVQLYKLKVMKQLNNMESNANKLRNQFRKFEYLWLTNAQELFAEFLTEVVSTEKIPFIDNNSNNNNNNNSNASSSNITATPATEGTTANGDDARDCWVKTTINLEKFGEKIKSFLDIQVEVSEIKTLHDINFLRINAQPVKQAISTWVTKWLYMHTQYLQNYVWNHLHDLYNLLQDVNKGLDTPVESGNRDALISVLSFFHNVRRRMPEIASLFEPMQRIVILLKSNGIAIDMPHIGGQPALDFLEHSKMLWDNTVNKAFRVKENIQPMQSMMLESIRKEVKQFNANVAKFVKDFRQSGPFVWPDHYNVREAYYALDRCQIQLVQLSTESKKINDLEELFELPLSTHSSIKEIEQDLRCLKDVWDTVMLVEFLFGMWKNTLWAEIQTDELLEEVKKIQNQLKIHPKKAKEWNVFKRLETEVKNMVICLPLVHELHSPAMRERHWKGLMNLTGVSIDRGPSFCLDDLLSLNLQYHVDAVSEIVEVATKELKIETKLTSIEESWRRFSLKFIQHRDTEVFIVAPPDEILEALEEHSLVLQSMVGMGKFVDFFREQVSYWLLCLGEVESTLRILLTVERQWGSLESIFLGSADIRAQLPDDTKRFEQVDNEFKEVMRDIQAKPGVLACCRAEGRETALSNMHKELEKCEKALNEYLEIKKGFFPRFYFVSNAALLDILSNGNSPPKIMPHVGSVFDGIGDLDLCPSQAQLKAQRDDPDANIGPLEAAKAMISKDNEIVPFETLFEMKGAVEYWLNDLVRFMQVTLKGVLNISMQDAVAWDDLNRTREDWIFTVPAQIALVTSQIIWTEEVEAALEELESGQEDSLKKYNEVCNLRLEALIRLVQMELTKGDRIKIITVITFDVHNRDVVSALIQKKVENNVDFKWQSQLRYYWLPEEKNVNIRICDFTTSYSFEYTGNCGRLVITPLTDRCYVTLTVALRLMMGGAPAGPAGTGKTETTKDLSRGLGVPCYVFNCSDQMNYQTMGDIFKGLTQVGAWGCFDEFNRIEIEVLSVVASQVRCILDAIIFHSVPANRQPAYQQLPAGTPPAKVGVFNFFGEQIALVPTVGMFITMNPGYAGRSELPENLKALFRSCAMIQPDFLPICENMLMAEGFVKARPLSVKFVTLYKLSSELLSKQHHYDWGLRAIKSVLRVAGMLKRADPDIDEDAVLMRALRDFNTPKIPSNDIPIFMRLISDLFPGLDLPPKVNEQLYKTCVEVCKTQGLMSEESFVGKVMQYQELLDVRHSVMLLGPAGCGKTTVWKTLAACHNHAAMTLTPRHGSKDTSGGNHNKAVTMYETVNPKSVTTDELYGYMTLTKDWKDGVLSIIMRNMSKNVSPYHASQTAKWVVLDGDIDAVWIESMNTVMDDNKVLTLVSNERIPLSESMRMIFEIHSLKHATPATVSRAGILFINENDIGFQPYLDSWLATRTQELEKSYLPYLINRYLVKVVEFFNATKMEKIVPLPMINLVQSLCYLLDGMIKAYSGEKNQASLERIFLFCLMWAFGGSLAADKQTDFRRVFSNFYRPLTSKAVKFPETGIVLDFFIDPSSGDAVPWNVNHLNMNNSSMTGGGNSTESNSGSGNNGGISISGGVMTVPTAESVRLQYCMGLLVKNSHPVMFVGSAGTGKTILVTDFLNNLISNDDQFKYTTVNMNYYTDSYALQMQLEQNIDKRSGKNYGPPTGKLIFFVDDLNLPVVETYGTQTPIALMRQHIDNGAWFDRSDLGLKKTISDCLYVACMNHKSGSFFVNPRLQRHFVTFSCPMPGESDLYTIFHTILSSHFFNFDKKIQAKLKNLTEATIALHKEITMKFLPSAVKFHYSFTMRDLTAVFRGLLNARVNEQTTSAQVARLWYHESSRVFSDRLVSEAEVNRCKDVIVNVGKRFLEDDADYAFMEPCYFAHFAPPPLGLSSSTARGNASTLDDSLSNYRNCDDMSRLKKIVEGKLFEYNETKAIMNLVMFDQALQHVLRISRILMFPGGHALLVGVGGSGKQSLSKLAAFIVEYDVFQISVTSDFGVNELKEHLKDMYRRSAIKPGLPLVFILTDSQITDERFLVYINDLLSSGRIPDLFSKEEFDGIFASLRNIAKSEGVPDNRDSMMDFFIGRVRCNLHMILCFSPVGEAFRNRVRKFPGIINCTMIDWFLEWPREALVSVAQRFLEDVEMPADRTDIKDNIAYHIAEVHTSVGIASTQYYKTEKRYNYTTPKSFLELVAFYKTLLKSRREELYANTKRLENGLLTLHRTNQDVEKLQEFLKSKKKEVEIKKQSTDKLLEEMGQQKSEAEAQQAIADIEKKKADAAAAEANALEQQAAGDLAIAKPALDAANDAINCLEKNSLTELKSFTKPPAGVDKVTTALLIMIKGEKKDFSWENAKKMMAKVDAFKEKLETYRGEDIPEDVIAKVTPMLDDPEFTFDKMKSKSAAAANLIKWVINIIGFNGIYKRVKPLMESLEVATKSKKKAEEDLGVVKEKIQVINTKLAKLQQEFTAAFEEKAKVEDEARECSNRLSLAERLTTGLSSEHERWSSTVEKLKATEITLAGDVMLAASFTSYLGSFNAIFRDYLWKDCWLNDLKSRDIPLSPNLDPLLHILSNESQLANWQNEGLPSDRISLENGAILSNSSRWPLLIDPQLQGIRWLVRHELNRAEKSGKNLIMVKNGEKGYLTKIITAITNGDTVILENVGEQIDASLDPILSKAIFKKGKTLYLKIGEEDVEYDINFKLYLQTKLANPHYKPEIFAQCTLINFIVTRKGLEEQLLATIVSEEEPELEKTRNDLIQSFNTYKIQLKELEDLLLERLSNAPPDILSDTPLIEGLEATKQTVTEINEAFAKGIQTEISINQAREVYRVIATEASLLYFILLQLNGIDHMYQYSLDSFTMFFLKALKNAPAAAVPLERVQNLQQTLRMTIFKFVNRGLFAKHKLIFLSQMTFSLIQAGMIGDECGYSVEGLRYLLFGPKSGDEKTSVSWISDSVWNGLKNLTTSVDGFDRLLSDIEENSPRFLEWMQNFAPESERLPGSWRELDKTPFKKLLVIRMLRPDRITSALTTFIREILPNGKDFVESDQELNSFQILENAFEDSSPVIPLYFILSPGADVVSDVDKLAVKYNKMKGLDYHNISLGQGQDKVAEEKLDLAYRQGHWVFLNNVHLMPKWLISMEKKLEQYASSSMQADLHPEFRIFFSSDPSVNIPVNILDRCIKITSDPPSGLKSNLKQAFACFSKETYEELESRTKGILLGLIHFHAVMIERKKFGAKGFNMNYPFSLGDLTCSFQVLKNYMESAPAKVPWADLRYLFGEIMYGGHIVNDFDRLLANTYLEFYMRDELLEEMSLFPFLDAQTMMAGGAGGGSAGGATAGGGGSGGGGQGGSSGGAGQAGSGGSGGNSGGAASLASMIELFKAPPTSSTYESIIDHLDDSLRTETPLAFGLHPNAEIGFRTQTSEELLKAVLELSATTLLSASAANNNNNNNSAADGDTSNTSNSSGGGGGGSGGNNTSTAVAPPGGSAGEGLDAQQVAEAAIQDILEQFRDVKFELESITSSLDDIGPFQNVLLQECERMNLLVQEMVRGLVELDMGFKGDLTVSEAMEELAFSLYMDRVPKRWEVIAYPSLRSLASWLADLNARISQLNDWMLGSGGGTGEMPIVTWLPGLFNPQSFLTAVMQITAQSASLELDKLTLVTEMTKKMNAEDMNTPAKDGTYIHGLYLEGASFNLSQGLLEAAKPREMFSALPVINIRPVIAEKQESGLFSCPVYKTQQRGPTYVFSLQLRSKYEPGKWVLAGVVSIMEVNI